MLQTLLFFGISIIVAQVSCFVLNSPRIIQKTTTKSLSMGLSDVEPIFNWISRSTLTLSDTSVSDEDVLDVVGRANDLPDPIYAVGFAAFVFAGVALLQFSLGDLTKEEGQARVRDFLQTRRETERKRGYFDD